MPASQHTESDVLHILPAGRYEISRLLGTGAFGQVYAGRDLSTGEPVVLKYIQLANREARARTEREISLLKKLATSPYAVALRDGIFSDDAKAAVLISEYIDGPTLQSLVESYGRGLPNHVVAAIAAQLCAGLEFLHGQGIVHRDIKPSNVLVSNQGMAKLLDLGVAVSLAVEDADDSDITKDGNFVGTMRYAAPEMLSGKQYGPASDVYGMGVTTLFMILGRQPFEGASFPFLINQVLNGKFITELPKSLKPVWENILSSSLDPNPENRPTPGALRASLETAFLAGERSENVIVADFIRSSGGFPEPPPAPPAPLSSMPEPEDERTLKGTVQSLAVQINEVQSALADITATFKNRELVGNSKVAKSALVSEEERIDATFATVRRRLELNWKFSLLMTFVLFSLFVAMLVLAVVFGLVYQKSSWGVVFGGTSGLSLLTVVIWKPMDKMLFSTIATQQLELIQLNYQRALSGTNKERREAFKDISTQLNALLTKVSSSKSR